MATVQTYQNSTPVTATSKFLGTDANGNTANFQASDVAAYTLGYATTITTKTGSYTIVLADLNTFMQYGTNAGTITTPASTDTTFIIGGELRIQFTVAGTVTIAAGSGITLQGTGSISTQWQVKTLKKISSTIWTIF